MVKKQLEILPDELKPIDILINNAGLALELCLCIRALMIKWDTMIDTNIKGLLYVSREVIAGNARAWSWAYC